MRRFAIVLALLAIAAYKPPGPVKTLEYTQVPATTLTSPVATSWLKVGGYTRLTFELAFVDADSSITRLDWSCVSAKDDTTPTGGSATYVVKSLILDGATGIATYRTLLPQIPVTGSENLILNIPINYRWLKCTFSSGAGTPGAPDTIQIDARASAGD
jgi:hypothetical protein